MRKSAKMSLGKFTYMISWLITGIFLIVLLVLFVVYKDKTNYKVPDKDGYNTIQQATPQGKITPKEEEVFVRIFDVNNDKQTGIAEKEVTYLDGVTKKTLVEGEFLEISNIKLIEDYKNYFDFHYYYVTTTGTGEAGWNEDQNIEIVKRDPIFTIDDASLEQVYTSEAISAQNDIAGVGLGFIVLIFGSIMGTVFVSMKEKKGGKK